MTSTFNALFNSVLLRIIVVYGTLFGYAILWRQLPVPHGNWTFAAMATGAASGLLAVILAMSTHLDQRLLRDRIYNALPVSIGALAIVATLIFFPSLFAKLWLTGFLAALPVPVAVLAVNRRAVKRLTAAGRAVA